MIRFNCTTCARELAVDNSLAGRTGKCSWCGGAITIPEPFASGTVTDLDKDPNLSSAPQYQEQPRDDNRYGDNRYGEAPPPQEGGSNAAVGWLIFLLIFGVGNVILYATTGIFLIPIPRR